MSRIAPALALHETAATDLDPVTYEVLRHRLWSINMANGEVLVRVSGSPIFQALDFNMSILTEDGEFVLNAPYAQTLNAGASLANDGR